MRLRLRSFNSREAGVLAVVMLFMMLIAIRTPAQKAPTPHLSTPTPRCDGGDQVRVFTGPDTVRYGFWCIPTATSKIDNQKHYSDQWTSLDVRQPFLARGYALAGEAVRLHELTVAQRRIPVGKDNNQAPPEVILRVDTIHLTEYRTDTLKLPGRTEYVPREVIRVDTVRKYVETPGKSCVRWWGLTPCNVPLYAGAIAAGTCGVMYLFHKYCFKNVNINENFNGQSSRSRASAWQATNAFLPEKPTVMARSRPITLLRFRF